MGTLAMLPACGRRVWASCQGLLRRQRGKLPRGMASDATKPAKEELEEEATSWFKDFAKSKPIILISGGLVLLGLNVAGSAAIDAYYQHQVVSTLLRGVTPAIEQPSVLLREPLREKVYSILHPKEPSRFYHIITGSPGTGKSTLVREACAAIGSGVGYVNVRPAFEVDWGQDLGNAFNFRFEEHMTLFNIMSQTVLGIKVRDRGEEHPLSSLKHSAEALRNAAAAFKAKTGRPFVLVIDSVDRLAQEKDSQKTMEAVLEYAREWAQEGTITCVFVANDFATVNKLRGEQPGSRAAPPVHICSLSPAEALQYLESMGIGRRLGEECVRLVGGALLLLERCAEMMRAGVPFSEVKEWLLSMIEHGFEDVGLLDSTPQQEAGLAVVEALLSSRSHAIPASQWRSMVPDKEMQSKLLKGGVLRFHSDELTFESRLALAYCRERLHSRLSPEQQAKHKGIGGRSPRGAWW